MTPAPEAVRTPASIVPGLQLVEEFVSESEEQRLLAAIDALPWRHDLQRRVQHYGWVYDYKRRSVDDSMKLGPLPAWAADLAERLRAARYMDPPPEQVIVNEYLPGQGISKHVDCEPCFGSVVASLTLGGATTMILQRGDVEHELRLPLRSLLVLSGEARFRWSHRIPARKSDQVDGQRVPRSRRVSLTFRTINRTRG